MPAITQARIPPVGGPLQFASGTTNSLSIGAAAPSAVAAVSTSLGVTQVSAVGGADITVTGSPITGIGTLVFGLSTTGVPPGTYTQVVVDSRGRVASGELGSLVASGGIPATVVQAHTLGVPLFWPAGSYTITQNLANFADVQHYGAGIITDGTYSFYVDGRAERTCRCGERLRNHSLTRRGNMFWFGLAIGGGAGVLIGGAIVVAMIIGSGFLVR